MSANEHTGDNLSVEASVAGEAAAAAVEEVQSRQETDAAATEAVLTADVAAEAASDAENTAHAAAETSIIAAETASLAEQSAQAAQEQTQAVAYATAEAFEALRAETDEKLRAMRDDISSRIPLPTPQDTVEEVDANERTAVRNPGESETPAETKPKPVARKRAAQQKRSAVSGTGTADPVSAPTPQFQPVDVPDVEAVSEPIPVREIAAKPEKTATSEPKSGPPSLNEWQDFFGRIVIKLIVDYYLFIVLGDLIDELSTHELKSILLSEEDLREVAAPLAELANKSGFMRKHGRFIVATADSFESVMTLLLWMRRVNRVAKKHRAAKPKTNRGRQQPTPQAAPSTNGYNHENAHGFGQGEDSGERPDGIPLGFFNPGTGA